MRIREYLMKQHSIADRNGATFMKHLFSKYSSQFLMQSSDCNFVLTETTKN